MTVFNPETQKIIPALPSQEVLMSMATKYNHAFVAPYDPNSRFKLGNSPDQRDALLNKMADIYLYVVNSTLGTNRAIVCEMDLETLEKVQAARNKFVFDKQDNRYVCGFSDEGKKTFDQKIAEQKQDISASYVIVPAIPEISLLNKIQAFFDQKPKDLENMNDTAHFFATRDARGSYDELSGSGFFKYPEFIIQN